MGVTRAHVAALHASAIAQGHPDPQAWAQSLYRAGESQRGIALVIGVCQSQVGKWVDGVVQGPRKRMSRPWHSCGRCTCYGECRQRVRQYEPLVRPECEPQEMRQ